MSVHLAVIKPKTVRKWLRKSKQRSKKTVIKARAELDETRLASAAESKWKIIQTANNGEDDS
jgi:hypothetical protein